MDSSVQKKVRYAAAALIVIFLAALIPLRLLDPSRFTPYGRLLWDYEANYSFISVDDEDFVTGVWTGSGENIRVFAFRAGADDPDLPDDAYFSCYLLDTSGNTVFDCSAAVLPMPDYGIYAVPVDVTLEEGDDYQFVIAVHGAGGLKILCDTERAPVVILDRDGECTSFYPMFATAAYLLCWGFGLILCFCILRARPKRTILDAALTAGLALLIMQYSSSHTAESAGAMRLSVIFAVFLLLMAVLIAGEKYRRFTTYIIIPFVALMFMLSIPPGEVPDEDAHFFRAFEISCGNLTSAKLEDGYGGNVLPSAVRYYRNPESEIDWSETEEISFPNTSLFSPVCYFPQALFIWAARLFTSNARTIFMCGRIGGMLFSLLCFLLAIRMIPYGKGLMTAVFMLPMVLQQGTSMSADAVTNALSFLFIAYALRLVTDGRKLRIRDYVVLIALSTGIAMCKFIYFAAVLLLILLKKEQFGERNRILKRSLLFGIPAVLCLISSMIFGGYLSMMPEGADAGGQIVYVLTHPVSYILVMLRSTVLDLFNWMTGMTVLGLGRFDISITKFLIILMIPVVFYLLSGTGATDRESAHGVSMICIIISVLGFLLVLAALYASWTPVGYPVIYGIQPRYFLPFLPYVLFAVICRRTARGSCLPVGDDRVESHMAEYHALMLAIDAIALLEVYRHFMI